MDEKQLNKEYIETILLIASNVAYGHTALADNVANWIPICLWCVQFLILMDLCILYYKVGNKSRFYLFIVLCVIDVISLDAVFRLRF